jgi:hypothetical protein
MARNEEPTMKNRSLIMQFAVFAALLLALASLVPQRAAGQAARERADTRTSLRTPWGHPDLQGVWNYATLTPLERPASVTKSVLTEEETAEYVKRARENSNADRRDGAGTQRSPGEDADVARAYNEFWYERGRGTVRNRRTSLIVDPADGRLPPMTPQGQKRASALAAYQKQGVRGPLDGPTTRPLRERCIWWDSEGPPLTPMSAYNQNVQILQTQDHVVVLMEMIHDARIIPLDRRPHLSRSISQLLGDSRGRWDGDTLVVETTNFRDKADFIDPSSFTPQTDYRGSGPGIHLIERFTRVDADSILYEYTVQDPTTWTRPWTAQFFLSKSPTPLYEYACHEGNYGMEGILSGARAAEQATDRRPVRR